MYLNYQSLFTLIAVAIAFLPGFLLLDRWWRERVYDLRGKTVLLTGGSRGLGLVMARQLLAAGARLAICARDATELERVQTELAPQGEVLGWTCDVTEQNQVEQLVQQVQQRLGTIEILINNAGTDIVGPLETLTMQDYEDLMKLHFWAPLYATYAVLPEMRTRKAGRIVNISSIGGKVVSPHMVAYCASKFALVGLSEGMRVELAKDGIAVTTVCPGLIRTGVVDHALMKGRHRQEFTWFTIGESLPLISASAEQVARATLAGLRRGATEVIVPFPAWLSAKLYPLFPGVNTALLSIVNWLLPKPGGIGQERAFGKDSHSTWAPSWLTVLSNRAAEQNNELPVIEPKATMEVKQVGIDEAQLHKQVAADRDPALATAPESTISLIDPAQTTPEIQACFQEIQDTLGIPWTPANWRAYAVYPSVMQLFWQRLKPATQTELFLEAAIAMTEQVYQDIHDWYQPSYHSQLEPDQQRQIQRELNAFSFGNPQLLIQQVALSRTLAGEVVGEEGPTEARRGPNAYRHPEIQLIGEPLAKTISADLPRVYQDIRQTLDVPIVNSDYQALARWPEFFIPAWEDVKRWRERPEYLLLKQAVLQRAEKAANRLRPAIVVGQQEVRDRLDNPEAVEQLQQTVQLFKNILPELIIQNALFHRGLMGVQSGIPRA